jgi:hypothetical protein
VVPMMCAAMLVPSRGRWRFHGAVRKPNRNLAGAYSRPIHWGAFHPNLRATQPSRQAPQPVLPRAKIDEGAQQHVAADSGRRVNDGKTAVGHRLGNIAP